MWNNLADPLGLHYGIEQIKNYVKRKFVHSIIDWSMCFSLRHLNLQSKLTTCRLSAMGSTGISIYFHIGYVYTDICLVYFLLKMDNVNRQLHLYLASSRTFPRQTLNDVYKCKWRSFFSLDMLRVLTAKWMSRLMPTFIFNLTTFAICYTYINVKCMHNLISCHINFIISTVICNFWNTVSETQG